jgi:hypothetical protein
LARRREKMGLWANKRPQALLFCQPAVILSSTIVEQVVIITGGENPHARHGDRSEQL